MKRGLLIVILALILAALGSHWYAVRQVEASLERLSSQLAPIGRLSWEQIRVDHRGEARVERLALRLRESRDPIRVDLLRYSAGGPLALIGASQDLSAMRLPDRMEIHIEGLSLPVNRELDSLIGQRDLALPFAAAGCADYENFSFYDLGELGLVELNLDLSLSYQLVNQQEELDIQSRAAILGLGDRHWRLRMALVDIDHSLTELSELLERSRLLRLDQDYLDQGYYHKLLAFCAAQTGLDLNEQIDWHLQAWMDRWGADGLRPGPLVVAGYRHFLQQPQRLSIRAADPAGVRLADTDQGLVKLLLAAMKPRFSIDEGTAVDLSFTPVEPGTVASSPAQFEPPAQVSETLTELESEVGFELGFELGLAPGWNLVEPSQAANHVGQRAQIQTRAGQRLSGRIAAVDDGFLHLSSRSRIGEFTRPISLTEIESLQVRP